MRVSEPSSFWGSPLPCHPLCWLHLTYCMPAQWLLLSSSPMLVLTLGWCLLCIATVIGGVALIGCAVVIGVLPGVGSSSACQNLISALKNKIK
jgi:hypothetical protein